MIQSYLESEAPDVAAALLQLARLKAGLSQRELAERASVPTTMISAYERGKRQPSLTTLLRLLEAAGFELRMTLEPHDPRNELTAALDDYQREAWRRATNDVTIADLDDVIRSKEAAGRPKDLRALPALYRHRASRSRASVGEDVRIDDVDR